MASSLYTPPLHFGTLLDIRDLFAFLRQSCSNWCRPRPPPPSQPCFVAASFDEWDVRALLVLHSCTRMVIADCSFCDHGSRLCPCRHHAAPGAHPPNFKMMRSTKRYKWHLLCHNHAVWRIDGTHIFTSTRLIVATSAPGLRSPLPHLRRDPAHRCDICSRTRLAAATFALD